MFQPSTRTVLTALAIMIAVTSCGFLCNDYACHVAGRPATASSIPSGIVGVVASASDVISNGCGECEFSSTTIGIWSTPTVISDETDAEALIASRPPDITVNANRRYEQALAPGDYLVCSTWVCMPLSLGANEVFTVNVVLSVGTFFRVWAPGVGQEMEEDEFHVDWH